MMSMHISVYLSEADLAETGCRTLDELKALLQAQLGNGRLPVFELMVSRTNFPTTTNGAEWKRFCVDPEFWPANRFQDDTCIRANGRRFKYNEVAALPDDALIEIDYGGVLDEDGQEFGELADYFAEWQRRQLTRRVVIELDPDRINDALVTIAASGGKVVY